LQVNPEKYLPYAVLVAEGLLKMQDPSGGIRDGNRNPNRVNTEPHMSCYAFFRELAAATGDRKWNRAADKAWRWFEKKALNEKEGTVLRGVWESGEPDLVHATDVYTWPIAMAADRLSLSTLRKLIATFERRSLVRITFTRPDRRQVTVVLPDFTDPEDLRRAPGSAGG